MERKIISIDEEKCTGCGLCIPDCPEGALQILDGKARLVSDLFCDGLGACLGTCPEGAISVMEREAEPYNEQAVMAVIVPQGEAVIRAHLDHLKSHGEDELFAQAISYLTRHAIPIPDITPTLRSGHEHHHGVQKHEGQRGHKHQVCGCPGSAPQQFSQESRTPHPSQAGGDVQSELSQWPVQLRLINPLNPVFKNADLLIAADCVPFAYGNFHRDFLKNKILVIFCPKLDEDIEEYSDKLAEIFTTHAIRSVTIVHMEVPCCSGTVAVTEKALQKSGKTIPVHEYTVGIRGEIQ